MKKLKNWKNACMLAGIFIFASCTSHTFHTVTIALDDACTPEQQILAYEVINNRIASIWRVREKSDLTDGKFNITHSGENALLERMLTQRGEVYITEMFEVNEISSELSLLLSEKPNLTRFLHQTIFGLLALPQHVSYIDSVLNQYKHFFPANLYFAWSAKPNSDVFYELFALKSNVQSFPLNPNTVRSSSIERDRWHHLPLISITLNREYHDEWARMTRENEGRNLAFVMDGRVLMSPRVNMEITGGRLSITGVNFETDDLLLIKSVIMGGVLDCKARIVK